MVSQNFIRRLKATAAAGAALVGVGLCGFAGGQTLPIAGNPREAAVQDRDAIRGVREQDEAALRTANQLNRDARQEARQALNAGTRPGSDEANLRRDSQGELRNMNAMNSGLRGADLGLWFNTRPGMNGLVVADVATQGAFASAGFREGDRIVSINGQPVTTEAQFVHALSAPNGAQTANIVIDRNGATQTLAIQPSAVMGGSAAFDPLFQAGLTLNQTDPNHLVVSQVFPRTPAFYAGLRAGDVINQVNGNPISSPAALTQALSGGGGVLSLEVNRNGQTRQLNLESIDTATRTAMRPNFNTINGQSDLSNVRTTGTTGQSVGQGNLSTGANTVNQVDQSGLNVGGTVTPGASTSANTTVPSTISGQTAIPGAPFSSTPFAPAGPTNASAIGTPGPTLSTSPGVLSANNTSPGVLSANQSAPTGFSTATPGFTGPQQLPGGAAGAGLINNATPIVGGTGVGGLGTSGLSPANSAVPAFGSAGAQGATGTTGGTGSTAGGVGAVGGTGASIGGTGSTAGPSGGSSSTGVGTGGAAASGAGAAAAGAGAAGGSGGAGAGGGAGGGGGAGAGGT